MTRIAVLDADRCRPQDCGRVCLKYCPMVRSRVEAIAFEKGKEKPTIVERLCSGCGICVKKCPFRSITIVNLPDELEVDCVHRFGENMFKLFRLPVPREGQVTGLIGRNGIGKSTALKILAGETKLNLGKYNDPPDWPEILDFYRGSTLQIYFNRLRTNRLKVVHKPQYVDRLSKAVSGEVGSLLEKIEGRSALKQVREELELGTIWDRKLSVLSGGELQRVAIAAAMLQEADVYIFDEPSSYLDVRQRIRVSKAIRGLAEGGRSVVVAEHDLAVLDYLSDQICILYGEPAVYGVVSHVYGVRIGINAYLSGYLPDENVRFRDLSIRFHVKPPLSSWEAIETIVSWDEMSKSFGFTLEVDPGSVRRGEVVGILGSNGIGKTTFVKMIAGLETPDSGSASSAEEISISYKPQYISTDYEGSVTELLRSIAEDDFSSSWYRSDVLAPFELDRILDREVRKLSGGELQRVAIVACLSKHALLYLLDEPSAYLDVEERLTMGKTIRRLIEDRKASALIVEHDIAAQDFLADRIMVFEGQPGIKGEASAPLNLRDGMNQFLRSMEITFRRDPSTSRPRVNKDGSRLDKLQKAQGEYYYIPQEKEAEEKPP